MMKVLLFSLCIFLFTPNLKSQKQNHQLYFNQKNDVVFKEIKVKKNNDLIMIEQYRKDNTLSFSKMSDFESDFKYNVQYNFEKNRENTTQSISANDKAGFLILRTESKKKFVKKTFLNKTSILPKDYNTNSFSSQIKKIKDSTDLITNKEVRRLLKQTPKLIAIEYFDSNGDKTRQENYYAGKLIGIEKILINHEGEKYNEFYEYKNTIPGTLFIKNSDGKIVYQSNSDFEDEISYDESNKLKSITTKKNKKIIWTTSFFYDKDKLTRREFQDFEKGEITIYTYTYNEKGKFDTIKKQTGDEADLYTFEYIYW